MIVSKTSLVAAVLSLACAAADHSTASATSSAAFDAGEVSVKDFGARGDGQTLDTAAIQAAVDAAPTRGTVRFPAGTYRIQSDRGIRLKDDVRIDLGGATIFAPNVNGARCRIFDVQGRRNVAIAGGTLVGSRSGSPEWGVGILASDAQDLVIEDMTFRDFFFDGILLTGNAGCQRVVVRRVVTETCRRTGLAIVHASDVTVQASAFTGTQGQSPEAGVNCEPNRGEDVRNVRFVGCRFRGNANVGLYFHKGNGAAVADLSVEDSVVEDNGNGIVVGGAMGVSIVKNRISGHRGRAKSGIVLGETTGAVVNDNQLEDNFRGIFSAGTSSVEIRGNTVIGMGAESVPVTGDDASGIVCLGLKGVQADACVVANNTVARCAGSGIVAQMVSRVQFLDNTISETGQRGVFLRSALASQVRGNSVTKAGLEGAGRYDAVELAYSAHDNVISTNIIRLGTGPRMAIGICKDCLRNQVTANTVLPY